MIESLTCAAAARAVGAGELDATELVADALDAIERRDGDIGAFVEVHADAARARAAEIDADPELRALPLAGVPVALKDNLCVRGQRTTAGSRIIEPFVPPYTATAVERLEAAGAVCLGKCNLDEFAMGSSTENSAFHPTRNPHDPEHVPGGSSGGPAAAVAAAEVLGALGSDTGGSIRQPAALCGVVGLKPTYGRVSRYGLIAFASSLDQIGPLARSVEDTALLLSAIAGVDPCDSTTVDRPVQRWAADLEREPAELTVGVPGAWLGDRLGGELPDGAGGDNDGGIDGAVRREVEATLSALEGVGVTVRPVELPHQHLAVATYYVIATAEASSNLARYDGVRYGLRAPADDLESMFSLTRSAGFGPEVKRRILLGTFVLSAGYYDAYYGRAQRVRTLLRRDFDRAFADVDVVVGPTSPTPAFRLGERTDDPLAMYLSDVFTVTANLAGLPAISVPCGATEAGLPVGFQVVGAPFREDRVLQVAALVERLRGTFPATAVT